MSLSVAPASIFLRKYASAQVDKRKAGRLAMAIQVAFQELGVFQTSNRKVPLQDDDAMPFQKVQVIENVERKADLAKIVNPMKGTLSSAGEAQSLQEAEAAIAKALHPEIKKREVTMRMGREGLVVSLKEMGFFGSGSFGARPACLGGELRLVERTKKTPGKPLVEGD